MDFGTFTWDEYHEWSDLVYGQQHLDKETAYNLVIANRNQSINDLIHQSKDGLQIWKRIG